MFSNGTALVLAADGSSVQTNPNGITIATHTDGRIIQTNLNGSTLETHPDNALVEIEFPLGLSPGGTVVKWPQIKRIQSASATKHYIAVDGTDIQVNQDGSIVVCWKPGTDKATVRQSDSEAESDIRESEAETT